MNLANITAEHLSRSLEVEVPEMYVVLAKHSVMGIESESICEILNVSMAELAEAESDEIYKLVRTQIGALYAANQATRAFGWDGIEETALQKLAARIEFEKDSDFLLKVAAVANKAQRRGKAESGVLDPTKAGRTAITITQRMVQRLQGNSETRITERQLSISDGSMSRVSFDEVDELLNVSQKRQIESELNADELFAEMESKL